ncbi:MAG: TerB family tellurite resistance protein [Ignavibacteriaceae bacterium]|nr:TerB family tellurite resistance protein [Ignavibacteriaceae bacterium]
MFTLLDKSEYLKGLLILARKNNSLDEKEKTVIRNVANRLGFSKDFYEDTLKYLMSNKYITEEPIKFSNPSIAKLFIKDGLELAYSDNELCEKELNWLKSIAKANQLAVDWLMESITEFENYRESYTKVPVK